MSTTFFVRRGANLFILSLAVSRRDKTCPKSPVLRGPEAKENPFQAHHKLQGAFLRLCRVINQQLERKFSSIFLPSGVRIDSGWNWTPKIG